METFQTWLSLKIEQKFPLAPYPMKNVSQDSQAVDDRGFYKSPENGQNAPEMHDKFTRNGMGWKLHFSTEEKNEKYTIAVLKSKGLMFKCGHGGERNEGKGFTVYAGSKEKAMKIADDINQRLATLILPPQGEVLVSDVQISGNIFGRFDAGGEWHQYGPKGIPWMRQDLENNFLRFQNKDRLGEFEERSRRKLEKEFGNFFTGG